MRLPKNWERWAVGALALAAIAVWATGGRGGTWPTGTEDTDMVPQEMGLPGEFMHWSPVSWSGRSHPYPANWVGQIGFLVNRQLPDYADQDG